MIYVIATVELKPGFRDEFLKHFRKLVPDVLREKGCRSYGPTVDVPTHIPAQLDRRDDVVTVIENWESIEHLEAHLVAPHMLAYRERVKPWVERVSLQILEPV